MDIGTNSVRLLITDAAGDELERHMQITRLGQGVDVTGALHPDAIARTVERAARATASSMRKHGGSRECARPPPAPRAMPRTAQCSSTRPSARSGARPELLPGEEEARLSFRGATTRPRPRAQGPIWWSTSAAAPRSSCSARSAPEQLISVDMGCVRMTERHLKSDPPSERASSRPASHDVRGVLERVRAAVDVQRMRRMVGLAGTITALGAMAKGLKRYDPKATHHMVLTREARERLFAQLARGHGGRAAQAC